MKKIILLAVLALSVQISFAQKSKVSSAWNYLKFEDFEKAKAAIDEASTNEASMNMWKTWYYKGIIYQAIHEKKLEDSLKIKDAVNTYYEAYKKSLEVDPKHDYSNEAIAGLDVASREYYNRAFDLYNAKEFDKSLDAFLMRLKIYDVIKIYSPTLPVDTSTTYNVASTADKINKTDIAIQHYEKLVQLKYKDAYSLLATDYCKIKDTTKALATLDAGSALYPTDAGIIYGFINIYAATQQFEKAIAKINDAIKLKPENEMLYIILGNAYEHNDKDAEAVTAYQKVLEKNPTNFDAIKSLGINLFNQAAKINKEMDALPNNAPQAKFDEITKRRDAVLAKALPYLEQAEKISPDDAELKRPLNRTKSLLGK
jgi:tetratricopeptide (TPR) repeat protein